MKRGTIIDAHVHPMSPRMDKGTIKDWTQQADEFDANINEPGPLDILINRMDKYHIDKAIGLVGIGLAAGPGINQTMLRIAREHSDRFPAIMVGFDVPEDRVNFDGEVAAREVDALLDLPEVRGVGEWSLTCGSGMIEWPELWAKYRPVMDVVAAHKSAVLFHTGSAPYSHTAPRPPIGNRAGRFATRTLWFYNPIFVDDIAVEYPDVPIIIGHMGVQGYYYFGTFADMALMVAARNPNVYLETSSAPFEVVERAISDPAIGPEKLVFGSDSLAPYSYYSYKGEYYPSYGKTPPGFYTDHHKYDLENIERLQIPDREKEMILGGNAARILRL
jgi:predicted TIM-barrel fold metal-dependent hydrolase